MMLSLSNNETARFVSLRLGIDEDIHDVCSFRLLHSDCGGECGYVNVAVAKEDGSIQRMRRSPRSSCLNEGLTPTRRRRINLHG